MSKRPPRFLGVTKKVGEVQELVTRIDVENGISAGINWKSWSSDMIPIFEEHSARNERGITMEEWYKLDPMERAMIVAIRRVTNAAKNIHADAEIKANKAKTQRK